MNTNNSRRSGYLKFFALLGIIITVSAWGTSFISTKVLMDRGGFTPVQMYTYRFSAAYLLLLLYTCRKSLLSKNWRDELTFLVCGVCSGSLYFITENFALKHTTAGNVSLLASISPIFTTILMGVFYRVRIGSGVILGSVIAFIGVGFIVFSGGDGMEIHPAGDLLALSAALSWGIYSIAVKRLLPVYNSFFITRKLFFYGSVTSLPLLFAAGAPYHLETLVDMAHPEYVLNFLFLVLMCSVMAYLLWNESIKILGAVTANNFLYGQPLVTMVAAALILHDPFTMLGGIGCVLIVGGLVLSDKYPDLRIRRMA